jgi:predicted transcriptional regulator
VNTTGLELKLQRVAADVRSGVLARAMGVHPSRITYIERSRVVAPHIVERYVAALATCTTVRTDAA